jgi:hypothetical protein
MRYHGRAFQQTSIDREQGNEAQVDGEPVADPAEASRPVT